MSLDKGDCAEIVGLENSPKLNGVYVYIETPPEEKTIPTKNGDLTTIWHGVSILPESQETGYIPAKNLKKANCRAIAIHLTGMEDFPPPVTPNIPINPDRS